MAFPAKLLGANERIEHELRPHWRILFLPALVLLVTVPVASFLAALVGSGGWRSGVRWALLAVALVVLAVWTVAPFLRWFTTQYVFTNRRIIVRSGILRRRGRDMPLSKVNNVSFEKSLLERLLNAGTLVVESASESGGMTIAHVRDVETIQREVYRLHEEDDAWRRADRDGDPWNDGPGTQVREAGGSRGADPTARPT